MKRLPGLLCVAPAVVLLAQTSRPGQPADPAVEQVESLPKKFPPEIMPPARTPARTEVKLTHSYCVHPDYDRKSLSIQRCESVPQGIRLISPFKKAKPEKEPAK
jgi:hypothetical protein